MTPPDFRDDFLALRDEPPPAASAPRTYTGKPRLRTTPSPFTQVIQPSRESSTPAKPALITPPALTRQPSVIPLVIALTVLIVTVVGVVVVLAIRQ